jgi:predicted  nucleic acid-binding Zn-ribbon protein
VNITPAIATRTVSDINTKPAVSAETTTTAPAQENKVSTPSESFTPQAGGESRLSAAWRGGVRKGVAWGSAVEKPLGGAAAIGLAAAGGLALAFGGAVVGGIIGGGFGPAVSALSTHGAWNFIKGSFSNVGTAIQLGSTAGAVMGLAGGLMLGKSAGDSVAHAAAFVPGFVAGSVQGFAKPGSVPAPEHKEKTTTEHRSELRGVFKSEGKVLSGLGVLSGAVGGFVGGATLTAAGSLVADVASGDFTFKSFLNQVGTQALIGGAIGGVGLAAVGGYGGEGIARASQWTYDKTIGRATAGQPNIKERIAQKEAELATRQSSLSEKAEGLAKQTEGYRNDHKANSDALVTREDKIAADEKRVAEDLSTIDGRIEKNATADYESRSAKPDASLDAKGNHGIVGERGSLDQWDAKLTKWQGELNTFRGELQSWEKKLDTKIDQDAAAIFGEERKPIDEHFGGLQKELDAYELKLNNYEADIKRRIDERYRQGINAEKPGVDSELSSARSDKTQSEREKSEARSTRDSAASRHDSAERSLQSAQQRLSNAESEESQLRSRISSLRSRISSLESQLSSCRSSS